MRKWICSSLCQYIVSACCLIFFNGKKNYSKKIFWSFCVVDVVIRLIWLKALIALLPIKKMYFQTTKNVLYDIQFTFFSKKINKALCKRFVYCCTFMKHDTKSKIENHHKNAISPVLNAIILHIRRLFIVFYTYNTHYPAYNKLVRLMAIHISKFHWKLLQMTFYLRIERRTHISKFECFSTTIQTIQLVFGIQWLSIAKYTLMHHSPYHQLSTIQFQR